jgi:hypothetical protein
MFLTQFKVFLCKNQTIFINTNSLWLPFCTVLSLSDFCDFYLTSEAETTNAPTPEACLCEWISTDDPAFDSDAEILRFRDQYCQVCF